MMKSRCYSELVKLKTYEERLRYLMLNGKVGEETFGFDRYLNQMFYKIPEWKNGARPRVIARDNGCDLGLPGYDIHGTVYVHHMIPITKQMILERDPILFDPEYLISTSYNTHQAITYGVTDLVLNTFAERKPNDTCPWRK